MMSLPRAFTVTVRTSPSRFRWPPSLEQESIPLAESYCQHDYISRLKISPLGFRFLLFISFRRYSRVIVSKRRRQYSVHGTTSEFRSDRKRHIYRAAHRNSHLVAATLLV